VGEKRAVHDNEILSQLTEVFQDVFDSDDITLTPELTPSDIPGWDSARYITLIVATEARFRIRFEPAELESMKTVGDFVRRIQSKLGRASAA
jgi:acyl carrier protein